MKTFFLNLLNRLYSLAGLRQLENIQASSADPNKEISELISDLDDVCKNFSFIPDEEKKKILHKAVITDPKITSLNAAFVYRHLAANADRFFTQQHHQPDNKPQPEPLTGEARAQKLREWQEEINKILHKDEVNKILQESRGNILPGGQEPTPKHRSTTPEEHAARELHNQWIRENYDKYGNKLETYQDENLWMRNRTQQS